MVSAGKHYGFEFSIDMPIQKYDDVQKMLLLYGVGYLSLNRTAITLSAGETQRLRLASLLGTGLTGVLYVLDEPTTGLHARDNAKLIGILKKLRNMGNTILVVEHDPEFIEAADYVIDMGPEAGKNGGNVIAAGTPEQIRNIPESVTGKYLFTSTLKTPCNLRSGNGKSIRIMNASKYNLKNVDVEIPLGKLVALTGVSGSGKSTLLFDVLYQYVESDFQNLSDCEGITGLNDFKEVLVIDQAPIGRSSRSNAATYADIFSLIRTLFAGLPKAKQNGIKAKDFSFNVAGGRCEKCEGAGVINVPMHFMPDIQVICPVCHGQRFQQHVLDVKYRGHSISDVLDMGINEAHSLFSDCNQVADRLSVLKQVGLGYLTLGQPASTLSGGEAQRIKLAKELGKASTGHTLYLLDEPTTGLHPQDVQKLIFLLNRMVDQGHSVIVIEHNMDFIQSSDWIIDFGPEGGTSGGQIIGAGTPEQIMSLQTSFTGRCLKNHNLI
ncbi:ATP-binding cassette domain-containing protein [Clostridium sp. DJ247]|uniref:ATP-binding cassette domain-containing protein n=1 Tax=Clostridium sp. DJ247 TaxID=2726188 RepID=UPI001A9B4B28|nr:ATP-binding cassette domain-containing protein [Clostridium sp. DJ247]